MFAATKAYAALSEIDKTALKDLKQEMSKKINGDVTIAEALMAVTPGVETPAKLVGC